MGKPFSAGVKGIAGLISIVLALLATHAATEEAVPLEQIAMGAELFAINCSPCHGARMQGSESAFDLRRFPHDQRERFVRSVTHGKNQMPPWGDLFRPEQIDALWAYVIAGERE